MPGKKRIDTILRGIKKIDLDRISESTAFFEFGEAKVLTWLNSRLITHNKTVKGQNTYSREELETLRRTGQ